MKTKVTPSFYVCVGDRRTALVSAGIITEIEITQVGHALTDQVWARRSPAGFQFLKGCPAAACGVFYVASCSRNLCFVARCSDVSSEKWQPGFPQDMFKNGDRG